VLTAAHHGLTAVSLQPSEQMRAATIGHISETNRGRFLAAPEHPHHRPAKDPRRAAIRITTNTQVAPAPQTGACAGFLRCHRVQRLPSLRHTDVPLERSLEDRRQTGRSEATPPKSRNLRPRTWTQAREWSR
jgi:hypothetical protein